MKAENESSGAIRHVGALVVLIVLPIDALYSRILPYGRQALFPWRIVVVPKT